MSLRTSEDSVRLFGGVRMIDAPCPANVARLDHGAMPMVADMHRYGIRVDLPLLRSIQSEVSTLKLNLESQLHSIIGNAYSDSNGKTHTPFNIGSPDHVARLLFHHLQVQGKSPVPMTKKGKRETTNDETLSLFKHPACKIILDWREADKLENTYILPLQLKADSDSRVHTKFNYTVAATGRLSSSNPNLQNIPTRTELGKKIRYAFIASRGRVLVSADASQIEMRVAAHRSQDPVMMEAFRRNEDIHTRTTCNVFGLDYATTMQLQAAVESGKATPAQVSAYKHFKQFQRLPCKTVGFGVLYGQTPEGLQTSLATEGVIWTLEQCSDLITNKFFGVYSALLAMLQRDYTRVRRYAMSWDYFGRVRLVPEARSSHRRIAEEGIRKAGNHPEQAGAQGHIKLAMAYLNPFMQDLTAHGDPVWPLLQIHDEIIAECEPVIAPDVAYEMAASISGSCPLSIPVLSSSDVAERWGELK